jgi:DNA mismatch endonuclease (patch repair protein)
MADFLTKIQRSKRMSLIRSRGNIDTELALAKMLRRFHITGWRRHQPVFGKPDFVFRQVRLAAFVDGCFWHGCPKCGHIPKTRRTYWRGKIHRNRNRDRMVNRTLRARGWRVMRIWEHELARKNQHRCLSRIQKALASTAKRNAVRRQVSRL